MRKNLTVFVFCFALLVFVSEAMAANEYVSPSFPPAALILSMCSHIGLPVDTYLGKVKDPQKTYLYHVYLCDVQSGDDTVYSMDFVKTDSNYWMVNLGEGLIVLQKTYSASHSGATGTPKIDMKIRY